MSTSNFETASYIEDLESQVSVLNDTVHSLRHELDDKDICIEELEADVRSLNTTNNELDFELEEARVCNRGLLDTQKTLDDNIEKLEHKLRKSENIITRLSAIADSKEEGDYYAQQYSVNTQAEIIDELENKVLSAEGLLNVCKQELTSYKTCFERVKTEKENLVIKYAELEKRFYTVFDLMASQIK